MNRTLPTLLRRGALSLAMSLGSIARADDAPAAEVELPPLQALVVPEEPDDPAVAPAAFAETPASPCDPFPFQTPVMLGDQAPLSRLQTFAIPGGNTFGGRNGAALLPSVRGFKIAENQSPRPQDRVYYSFNFYDDVNNALNRRFHYPVYGVQVYREILGVEKTFLDGRASLGLRMPIDTLSASSSIRGFGGQSTAVGDLAIIGKYMIYEDVHRGRLASIGMLITAPTGPSHFAGFHRVYSPNSTAFQPFVGFIKNWRDFYFQGFASIDIPTAPNDVVMYYKDVGAGYYLYRSAEPSRWLTLIAPTCELHLNTPLNHRDVLKPNTINGTPEVVDLTFGLNVGITPRGILSIGYVEPVTGPRPFNGEALALFNLRF